MSVTSTALVVLYACSVCPLYSLVFTTSRLRKDFISRASARWRRHGSARGVVVEYMDRARGHTLDIFTQTSRGTHTNTAKVTYFSYGGTYRDEHSASFTRAQLLYLWRLIAVVAATVSATCVTVKGLQGTDPQRAHKPPPCIAPLSVFSAVCRAHHHPVKGPPCRSRQLSHMHACESTDAVERPASGDATK